MDARTLQADFRRVGQVTPHHAHGGVGGVGDGSASPLPGPASTVSSMPGKRTCAAPSARPGISARGGNLAHMVQRTRVANTPDVPLREVWLDVDVARYLHVSPRTVKRMVAKPRPGELDLRRANPVFVGDRRWYADNVKALVRDGVTVGVEVRP